MLGITRKMQLSNGVQVTDALRKELESKGVIALMAVNGDTIFIYDIVNTDYDFESYITYKVADLNGKLKKSRQYDQMNDTKARINGEWVSINSIFIL